MDCLAGVGGRQEKREANNSLRWQCWASLPLHRKPTLNIEGLKKFEYICSLVHGGTRKGNNITPTVISYLSFHVPSDCLAQPKIPKQFSQCCTLKSPWDLWASACFKRIHQLLGCSALCVVCICLIFFNQLEQFTFLMITIESFMSCKIQRLLLHVLILLS